MRVYTERCLRNLQDRMIVCGFEGWDVFIVLGVALVLQMVKVNGLAVWVIAGLLSAFLILIKKGKKHYFALCLEFDVASQGKTIQEARKNLQEAVEVFIDEVKRSGDQKIFFKRRAPYKYWQEYYKAYSKQFPAQVLKETAKSSHHPHITLQPVYT